MVVQSREEVFALPFLGWTGVRLAVCVTCGSVEEKEEVEEVQFPELQCRERERDENYDTPNLANTVSKVWDEVSFISHRGKRVFLSRCTKLILFFSAEWFSLPS